MARSTQRTRHRLPRTNQVKAETRPKLKDLYTPEVTSSRRRGSVRVGVERGSAIGSADDHVAWRHRHQVHQTARMVGAGQLGNPLDVRVQFTAARGALVQLLRDLHPVEWTVPTICPGWTVRDMATHLLHDDLRRLSRTRDHYSQAVSPTTAGDLVDFLNEANERWVHENRFLSPHLVTELLGHTGRLIEVMWDAADLDAVSEGVWWAGIDPRKCPAPATRASPRPEPVPLHLDGLVDLDGPAAGQHRATLRFCRRITQRAGRHDRVAARARLAPRRLGSAAGGARSALLHGGCFAGVCGRCLSGLRIWRCSDSSPSGRPIPRRRPMSARLRRGGENAPDSPCASSHPAPHPVPRPGRPGAARRQPRPCPPRRCSAARPLTPERQPPQAHRCSSRSCHRHETTTPGPDPATTAACPGSAPPAVTASSPDHRTGRAGTQAQARRRIGSDSPRTATGVGSAAGGVRSRGPLWRLHRDGEVAQAAPPRGRAIGARLPGRRHGCQTHLARQFPG